VDLPNESAYVDRITQIVGNKLNFSLKVVENDYYGHLFGPDEDTSSNEELVRRNNAARKAQESAVKESETETGEEAESEAEIEEAD